MSTVLHFLIPFAIVAVAFVLLLGLLNMMRGGTAQRSQQLMRARVMLQAVAVAIIIGALYFARHS